jgi:hypothetical protein
MYSTCLFCHTRLGGNDTIERFPVGRRLAFDAAKGRLWVVCHGCGRWNLSPLDERWEAIEDCERRFRQTRIRVTTEHVGLARLRDGLELVRIGAPLRPEFAAWRYGTRFRRRRTRAQIAAATTVIAAGAGAVAFAPLLLPALATTTVSVITLPGLTTVFGTAPVLGALALRDYFNNERVLGRLFHHDRVLTVRAKHARSTQLHVRGHDATSVALDVQHDAGWAHLEGLEAMQAASLLLAGANRYGAPASQVQDAVRRVEELGDAATYLHAASTLGGARNTRFVSLLNIWRRIGTLHLSSTECLALEMALHEESERRALEGELALLESAWRDAEEIARISDSL